MKLKIFGLIIVVLAMSGMQHACSVENEARRHPCCRSSR